MTHEYPHDPTFDSVTISRVMGLNDFGFTRRQREFLVTVMVHAGCFLERQYCTFTGTARGQNSRDFVARLVARGFARAIEPGPVRRGRLYHVHHKPLYEALGQPDGRNRRLHTISRMVERVMILDAVLSDRRCWWLSPEADKRTFFDVTQERGLRPEEYPHITFGSAPRKTVRCFPDKLPIGIEKEDGSRFVFLYLVNRRIPVDFRQFLIRHHNLLLNLHRWTVRLLVPRRFRKSVALYKAAVREELWTPLNPSVSKALEMYFRERKEQGGHLGEPPRNRTENPQIKRTTGALPPMSGAYFRLGIPSIRLLISSAGFRLSLPRSVSDSVSGQRRGDRPILTRRMISQRWRRTCVVS